MWFSPVKEVTYVQVCVWALPLYEVNCCRVLGDPTMMTGTTKGRPCRVALQVSRERDKTVSCISFCEIFIRILSSGGEWSLL